MTSRRKRRSQLIRKKISNITTVVKLAVVVMTSVMMAASTTTTRGVRFVRPFVVLSTNAYIHRPFIRSSWYFSSVSSSPSPSSIWKPTKLGLVPSCEEFLQERRFRQGDDNGNSNSTICLSYLTDVEGDKAYLDRYVETSKVLTFVDVSSTTSSSLSNENLPYKFPYNRRIDFVDDNSMLVFGGDLWDKGGYDLYVARQLLDLKRRHPSRVLWVLGNRDINKLRILQELGLPGMSIPDHPGLKWFLNSGRVGDPDGPLPSHDPGERLSWILSQTMGSPNAFEHRRNELDWERRGCPDEDQNDAQAASVSSVTDLDVVESYRKSCGPNGEMGLFLQQAYLAARVGPVLIVHGSLPLTQDVMDRAEQESKSVWDDMSTFLPWLSTEEKRELKLDTIEEWIDALNQFCHDNLERWKVDIEKLEKGEIKPRKPKNAIWAYQAGYNRGPPYSGLIQYGMGRLPDGQKNPGVVYNSFTPEGWPASFAEKSRVAECTREFFERSCVQLILSGHKPQGDSPSPIRINDKSWVICADTSYSGDTHWWHDDSDTTIVQERTSLGQTDKSERRKNLGRGKAVSFRGDVCVSEVLVNLADYGNTLESVMMHGMLSDGVEYETVNLLDATSQNVTIGQVAPHHMVPSELDSPHQGRWWTKSIFSDGSHLFHAGEGFNVWNFMRTTNQVNPEANPGVMTEASHGSSS
jgi:hypothetical protein